MEKKLYLNIAYRPGFRGAQGEWLYDANNFIWKDNNVDNIKYGKDGYRLCHYHLISRINLRTEIVIRQYMQGKRARQQRPQQDSISPRS